MALTANSIYAYVDLNDSQVFLRTAELNDRGDWSASPSYAVMDAVLYEGAHYVCLTANTNTAPDGNISDEWSTLALIREGVGDLTLEEVYEIATEALILAQFGTVYIGTTAAQGSSFSFNLYVQGTNYTSVAVQSGSDFAFNLFVTGTNYTDTEVVEAIQDGSAYAYGLYVQGTNYTDGQITVEQNARIDGDLNTFWDGTDYANSLIVPASGSAYAYSLFVAGTNYTNSQIEIEVGDRIDGDLSTFWAGTDYANSLVGPSGGSEYAYSLYVQGTNYTNSQIAVEVVNRVNGDLNTFWDGTAYTDSQIAQVAADGSNYALSLFQSGTGTGAAIQLTDAGSASDGAGLATARVGDNLPIKRLKAGQNVAVSSTGSNVEVSVLAVDTNTIQWTGPSFGEVTTGAPSSGTLVLDFAGAAYTTANVAAATHVAVTGMASGKGISARLLTGSTGYDLTFQSGIRFVGEIPTSIEANKVAVLSLCAFGSLVSDVVAVYAAEQ